MLVKPFRNTFPIHYVVFFVLSIIYQLPMLLNIKFLHISAPGDKSLFWNWISSGNNIVISIVAMVILLLCVFLTIVTSQNNSLITKTSSLPAAVFIFLSGFRMLTPEMFAAVLIFLCLYRIMETVNEHAYREMDFLSAGTMVGLACLLTPNALYYIFIILISMFILRITNIRYIFLIILGFGLPMFFYAIALTITGQLALFIPSLTPDYTFANIAITSLSSHGENTYYILYLAIAVIAILMTFPKIPSMTLSLREKYLIIIFSALIALASSFFTNNCTSFLLLSVPPMTFILSFFLSEIKPFWETLLSLLILMLPLFLFL